MMRRDTIDAIVCDARGNEQSAANELLGIVSYLTRDLDDDNRFIVAWSLLKLAAELDRTIQLRPFH